MFRHHAAAVLIVACSSSLLFAQGHRGSYPTVIGATGQPYGPTQAEYQYQLRYGHPSPGNTGGGMRYVNGYPGVSGGGYGGYGGYWYGGYSPYYYMDIGPYVTPPGAGYIYYPSSAYYGNYGNTNFGYPTTQPFIGTASPAVMQPLDPLQNGIYGNGGATYTNYPALTGTTPIIQQSTPKAIENSFEYQTQGDLQLQQLNYLTASERYRKSIDAARDRADPRYRMAVTLAARSRFMEAVDQLKLAAQLDPTWPQHASRLDQLFGSQNTFEKTRVKQRVAEWTLQDARDPNRLFLLGAMLYMDGDPNSKTMIDTAILVAGRQDYLVAFTAPRAEPILPAQAPVNMNAANGAAAANKGVAPPIPNPPQANQPQPAQPANPPKAPGQMAPVLPRLPQQQPGPQPTPITPPAGKAPAETAPVNSLPIPAIPPLPEEDSKMETQSVPPVPAEGTPAKDDLSGPTLPPLP